MASPGELLVSGFQVAAQKKFQTGQLRLGAGNLEARRAELDEEKKKTLATRVKDVVDNTTSSIKVLSKAIAAGDIGATKRVPIVLNSVERNAQILESAGSTVEANNLRAMAIDLQQIVPTTQADIGAAKGAAAGAEKSALVDSLAEIPGTDGEPLGREPALRLVGLIDEDGDAASRAQKWLRLLNTSASNLTPEGLTGLANQIAAADPEIERFLSEFTGGLAPTAAGVPKSDLLDERGQVKNEVVSTIRVLVSDLFESVIDARGEIRFLDPTSGTKLLGIIDLATQYLTSGEETSITSAVARAARQAGEDVRNFELNQISPGEEPETTGQTTRDVGAGVSMPLNIEEIEGIKERFKDTSFGKRGFKLGKFVPDVGVEVFDNDGNLIGHYR